MIEETSLRVPSFCPLCKMLMKGSKSTQTYYDHGVCINCYIQFIEDRVERWKSGWRPTQEDIDRYVDSMF